MSTDDTNHKIQLFQGQRVRTAWDADEEKWYFSVVDVVAVLTDQTDAKKASTYWSVLKGRLKKEGADQPLTNCKKLKLLSADGKMHPTDVADAQVLFRIIQSIPSKKAEPFKQWMARVAQEGAEVARGTRDDIEARIGHTIISSERAIDHTNPEGALPLNDPAPFAE